MRPAHSRLKMALVLVALFAMVAFAWRPVRQAFAMAALRESARGLVKFSEQGTYPEILPESVNSAVCGLLELLVKDQDRRDACVEYFHSLFRGPIDRIEIAREGALRENFEADLLRFRHVRVLGYHDDFSNAPHDGDAWRICAAARQLPKLEWLAVSFQLLTADDIAPLRGHPTLKRLHLGRNGISSEWLETLRTLPSLRKFSHGDPHHVVPPLQPAQNQKSFADAMPAVTVILH